MTEKKPENTPCPVCGAVDFEWGKLQASGLTFIPEGSSITRNIFAGGFRLKARKCKSCQNVQLFARD